MRLFLFNLDQSILFKLQNALFFYGVFFTTCLHWLNKNPPFALPGFLSLKKVRSKNFISDVFLCAKTIRLVPKFPWTWDFIVLLNDINLCMKNNLQIEGGKNIYVKTVFFFTGLVFGLVVKIWSFMRRLRAFEGIFGQHFLPYSTLFGFWRKTDFQNITQNNSFF